MLIFYSIISLFLVLHKVECGKIMFFMGLSSYSHKAGILPLAETLADRGHSVTIVSPFPSIQPHPNITDLVPLSLKSWVEMASSSENNLFYKSRIEGTLDYDWFALLDLSIEMCSSLLNDTAYTDWVKRSDFDLVIVDALCSECAYGMAYKFGAKLIVFSTTALYPWHSEPFGYPTESSWVPEMVFHQPLPMSFHHRVEATLVPLYFNYLREYHYFPKLEELIKEKLKIQDLPSLKDIERNNVSLVFANQHYTEDYPRPLPPNIINIGGMHCKTNPGQIPEELEKFINGTDSEGFIYISFGSYVKFSTLPPFVHKVFLKTFQKFKNIRFIWKSDMDMGQNTMAENIFFTTKWIPQQALLAHPKIFAFVTHGGIYGIQEAICHSVPLIVFPIFAEQDYNAVKVGSRDLGIHLDYTKITEKSFGNAIHDIIHNKKYSRNMLKASKEFLDRPEKPLEKAVWWTEFVLRHEDTKFLRPESVLQPWWLRRQLDVWLFLLVTFFTVLIATITLIIVVLYKLERIWSFLCKITQGKMKLN